MILAIGFVCAVLFMLCLVDPPQHQPEGLVAPPGEVPGLVEARLLGSHDAPAELEHRLVPHGTVSLDTARTAEWHGYLASKFEHGYELPAVGVALLGYRFRCYVVNDRLGTEEPWDGRRHSNGA